MNKRKGLSTKISPNDQSLIKYVYYNYDSSQIDSLKFTFDLETTYLKGSLAGQINLKVTGHSNQSELSKQKNQTINQFNHQVIKFFDTGSVNSISSNLEKITNSQSHYFIVKTDIQRKAVLQLFQMRLCQHIPEETTIKKLLQEQKKQQQKNSKVTRKMQKVQPIYCKKCGQRLYYFYFNEQKSITYGDLQKQIQLDDQQQKLQNVQWSVGLGQTFTKSTGIAKLNENQFFLQQNGKITYLSRLSELSPVTKFTQILRYQQIYCQHQKIQSNICQYCFEEVDPYQLNLKKFLFQMQQKDEFKRQMITTGSTLTQQQNLFVDDLLQKEKGLLILDLDNTVLHSIQLGQIHQSRLEQIQQFYELKLGSMLQYRRQIGAHFFTSCFIVKMRPYFKEFIQTAINFYEIYVYTKGTRMYAQEICNAIRNQYASKQHYSINKNSKIKYFDFLKDRNAFTPSRIITRDEDPDLQKKSLNNILPTRQQNLMVMDDLGSVWNYSAAVLYTVPFHFFFKKKHINAQKERQNNKITKIKGQALDESKQGQKLQPVQDLHAQNIEPVRELPCDHFQREVAEIESKLFQSVTDTPCNHFEKSINQIDSLQKKQRQNLLNNQIIESKQINGSAEININDSQPGVLEIKKGLAPQDKQYDYDILPRSDFYLIYAAYNLVQIHKQFFTERKLQKNGDKKISFGHMHIKLKTELLNDISVKFCMKNQTKIDIYGRAIKIGCKVLSGDSQSIPQYIIRLNSIKSNIDRMYFKKDQESQRKQILKQQSEIQSGTIKQLKYYSQILKIPIVSESWIDFCYSFTYKFPVQPFIIDSDNVFKDVHEEQYEWIIEQNAKNLLNKINKENQRINKEKSDKISKQ